jgi:hypothetical protein
VTRSSDKGKNSAAKNNAFSKTHTTAAPNSGPLVRISGLLCVLTCVSACAFDLRARADPGKSPDIAMA